MMKKWLTTTASLAMIIALLSGSLALADDGPGDGYTSDTVIVRVYYPDLDIANRVLISFEPWIFETNYEEGYHLMKVTQREIDLLTDAGLQVVVADLQQLPTVQAIPSYPCYQTVEETFAFAEALAAAYPDLATWTDVGNSWEKSAGLGGYDLMVLRLTNSAVPGPKPRLFATGVVHAREYATAPLLVRFAEYLTDNYGADADATWILDHHEVHLMLHTNPDGRKKAEGGVWWRKNTNQNYCSPTSSYRGADLNRNFDYQWGCCGGSSGNQCSTTYRGPSPASEPETQAVQDYMRAQFPDQRGPSLDDPAPDDATGVYLDIHSYGRLVLWPWGFTSVAAPNGTQLQTLGRKFAYWNGYEPQQAIGLYVTDGATDDFAYGDLGVASYCFELGTAFFQSCSYFEDAIVPDNMPALIYAAKVVRTPYLTPAGPDAYNLALSDDPVPAGTPVTLSGAINDTRYNNSHGAEPTQDIAAAEYYVDTPPWVATSTAIALSASDGSFDSKTENVEATIDTTGLSEGKHIVFVRGQDMDGNWGAFSAIFLSVTEGTPSPPIMLVDDDNGSSYEVYFTAALDTLAPENGYDAWNVESQGSPAASTLRQYDVVLWLTGDDYAATLTSTDQSNLATYLDGGGNLFITGQDVGRSVGESAFYSDYLHAAYVQDDTDLSGLNGVSGDPISDGLKVDISGGDGANNQSRPSEIDPVARAVTIFTYTLSAATTPGESVELRGMASSGSGAIRVDGGTYKVVYFAFGFEAINAAADRQLVMERVLDWTWSLFGDFDFNCVVNVADVMKVANRWRVVDTDPDWNPRYDLDNDGNIDIVDIMLVVAHWGETCQ